MNITRENYEAYMLDLIEGNISSINKAELYKFLDRNPELKAELNNFEDVKLVAENRKYKNKNSLKKDASIHIESISEIDRLSIAYLENDITKSESANLEELLKTRPEKQFDFDIIQQTKLKVDNNIKYNNKSKLKKRIILQKQVIRIAYSIAAILILYIGFSSVFYQANLIKTNNNKIVYIKNNIKIREFKFEENIIVKQTTSKTIKTNKIDNKTIIEKTEYRNKEQIAFLDNINADKVLLNNSNLFNIEKLTKLNTNYTNNSITSSEVNKDDFTKKIQQLLYENSFEKTKKTLFAAISTNIKKFLKKKFHIRKIETSDNRKIIAFEYYINKSKKKR